MIYVNDFPNCTTNGNTIIFADDTNIFFKGKCCKSLFSIANQELKNIDSWLNANKLTPNVKKTNFLVMQEASDAHSKTADSDTVSTYQVSSVQLVTDKKLEAFNKT